MAGVWQGDKTEGRMFFFEKRNQKTFAIRTTEPGERIRQMIKVFCYFSSEKKAFLYVQVLI
jgi:hypothetical protein